MKLPALPKPAGQKRFQQAVQRHPDVLYHDNFKLLPEAQNPAREHLFMPKPAGVPAEAKAPKPPTGNVRQHWSGK